MRRKRKLTNILRLEVLAGAGLLLLMGCADNPKNPGWEYMPDMYRSPSYETYSASDVAADGKSAMLPPEGTVARGMKPYPFPNSKEGYLMADSLLTNPIEVSDEILAEGQVLYLDFCSHCHGATGGGDGKIVQIEKFPPPPAFDGPLKDLSDGKMFHSITFGKNLMGGHASQLTPDERWKIIHFINTMQ